MEGIKSKDEDEESVIKYFMANFLRVMNKLLISLWHTRDDQYLWSVRMGEWLNDMIIYLVNCP